MWFNRGSGGSSVRLNRLPHGFVPASLRCLCARDPESLGKALQDCLRALGTHKAPIHLPRQRHKPRQHLQPPTWPTRFR